MCAWKVVTHSDLNVSVVAMPGFLKLEILAVLLERIDDSFNSIYFHLESGI